MLSFHNDQAIKDFYIARLVAHRDADELIKGIGWTGGKGCAVGCTLHAYNHKAYEDELGIPEALARIQDRLFECLPDRLSQQWPIRFLQSIPVGVDLSLVVWQYLHRIVSDVVEKHGTDDVKKGCAHAIDVLRRKALGEVVTEAEAEAARTAADAADAAYAAAHNVARTVAYAAAAAAYAAAASTASTAFAVADAADAAYAARSKSYEYQADILISLLQATEVTPHESKP